MLDETGADNACRNGDHANAQKRDDGTDDSPHHRHGIDVAIANRRQRGDSPP